jgi:hypothetical protein
MMDQKEKDKEQFFLDDFIHPDFIKDELQYSRTYRYLDRYVNDGVFIDGGRPVNHSIRLNKTIWSLWWQGNNTMPMLVQRCLESVRDNKPTDYDFVIISSENIGEYVSLPDYVWDKYHEGMISTTHLSDIIRMELLSVYGGCWVDATIFCSESVPEYILDNDLFFFKSSKMDKPVHKGSSWWISAKAENKLVIGTRNVLRAYWVNEEKLIDYYLLHAIIAKLIDTDKECGALFGSMPYFNNSNTHSLWGKLDKDFHEKEWEWIKKSSMVHKLSYKQKHILGDRNTFYSALINRELK